MANNDKLTVATKEDYTFELLLNDIHDSAAGSEDDALADERAERERKSKLVVLQMLIVKANKYNDDSHRDDEKLRNAIDAKLNADLAGYIYFISQNPQFDYSWNYLRKRENSYKEFLVEGIRFLENVLADINMLAGMPRIAKDVHVVMNDIIDVKLTADKSFVKTGVLWENFHRMATVKRSYSFIVKSKDSILVAGMRKEASDAEKLMTAALAMINEQKNIQNGQEAKVD